MAHHQLFSGPSMNKSSIILIIKVCIPADGLLTGCSLNRNISNQVKQEVNQSLTTLCFTVFDPFFSGCGRIYPQTCHLLWVECFRPGAELALGLFVTRSRAAGLDKMSPAWQVGFYLLVLGADKS